MSSKSKKNPKNILLSVKDVSYQYSDALKAEYALKDVNYDF